MMERLAHYEIQEKIGQGGMGAVYLARDTRLQRNVALKVLPEMFLQDAERLARFEREAQLLAQLSHPHVAQVYGFEEFEGQRFLVMEYVPGEDLTARILRGRIPVDETVRIARQVAEALEAAHDAGIVHRDLKPSNIRITPEDGVKVLDFGLAKALEGDPNQSASDMSISPTITGMMTAANVILGTAAYMSPEQARGKRVDRRADIWAFGAVVYEMLTGRQAFSGETVSDVLAAVLKTEPDRDDLPDDTPPALRRLVDRCLEKDPKVRLRDIGEARILFAGPMDEPGASVLAAAPARRSSLLWLAALVGVALVAAGIGWFLKPVPERPLLNFDLEVPPGAGILVWNNQAVSPDGKFLAFTASDSATGTNLYLRSLDEPTSRKVEGTEDAMFPFWSPDSKQIAYRSLRTNRLERIAVDGGAPIPITEVDNFRGGTWAEDGTILFTPASRAGLYRVPALGGTPQMVTQPDSALGGSHRWPWFLPGGDRFLYLEALGADQGVVKVGSLSDSSLHQTILELEGNAVYEDGHLFYERGGILHAQEFDPSSLALGAVQVVANGLYRNDMVALSAFSVGNGVISYLQSEATRAGRGGVAEFDAEGNQIGTYDMGGTTDDLTITGDGRRLAAMVGNQSKIDIWVLDTDRDIKTRISFDGISDDPVLSPDGREVVYASGGNLVRRRVDAAGEPEVLLDDERDKVPSQWTADGEIIYCTGGDQETLCRYDLETGEDKVLRQGEFRYMLGQVSPDGKWIAYVCTEGGERDVYVEDYPAMRTRIRVSRNQGTFPRWARGGNRLWYMDSEQGVREVTVETAGGEFRVLSDEKRFRIPSAAWMSRTHQIAVSADGTRIYALNSTDAGAITHVLRVIYGWKPEK